MRIFCPKCGAPNEIEEELLYVPVRCQKCEHEFVPRDHDGSTTPSPTFKAGPARPGSGQTGDGSRPGRAGFGSIFISFGVIVYLFFAYFFNTSIIEEDG